MSDDTSKGPLVKDALYNHFGIIRIAIDTMFLEDIVNPNGVKHHATTSTDLVTLPGTVEWVDRMTRIRRALMTDLKNTRAELSRAETHWANFKEALLEKAVDHDFCEDYDTFAAEWDLTPRTKEWDVVMTVRVRERNEEDALDFVKKRCDLSGATAMLHEDIVGEVNFSAHEA
jgi:hypothetical protein